MAPLWSGIESDQVGLAHGPHVRALQPGKSVGCALATAIVWQRRWHQEMVRPRKAEVGLGGGLRTQQPGTGVKNYSEETYIHRRIRVHTDVHTHAEKKKINEILFSF